MLSEAEVRRLLSDFEASRWTWDDSFEVTTADGHKIQGTRSYIDDNVAVLILDGNEIRVPINEITNVIIAISSPGPE